MIRSGLGKKWGGRNRNTERETHIVTDRERWKESLKETERQRKIEKK